jgi:hypothetical protein
LSFPDVNKTPTEQAIAPPYKNTPVLGRCLGLHSAAATFHNRGNSGIPLFEVCERRGIQIVQFLTDSVARVVGTFIQKMLPFFAVIIVFDLGHLCRQIEPSLQIVVTIVAIAVLKRTLDQLARMLELGIHQILSQRISHYFALAALSAPARA